MTIQSDTNPASRLQMQELIRRSILWIFALFLTASLAAILSFNIVRGPVVSVTEGEPSPEEVIVPESTSYVSEILTDGRRQAAAEAVSDQYTSLDLTIARAQNNYARSVFSFIDVVRADSMAERDEKLATLSAIDGLTIEPQLAEDLLALSQAEFAAAKDNIIQIVENSLRQGVVEGQVQEAKSRAALGADFDLSPAQERVVTSLAPQFIVPNIFLDEEATNNLKEQAVEQVEPVTRILTAGQVILAVGDIVDDEDIESLERLGLLQPRLDWKRALSAILTAFLATMLVILYWGQYYIERDGVARNLTIVGFLLVLFSVSAKLLTAGAGNISFLFPAAAFSIIVAVIFEVRLAIILTSILAALTGYMAKESLELALFASVGGIMAILTLRDVQRINALFRAGLVAAIGNIAVILVFRLPTDIDTQEFFTLILFGIINGPLLSAGLSLAGIFIIGSVFGIVTSLQIQELSRLDHPLLQELLRKAPGTYHHSIMVANLAEQGSEKIRANSPLVRVGSFYHDVGKMNRPPFFSENQNGGNPHDSLDPYSSARIIKSHVTDGLELARRYRLPNRLRDFIGEHHGDRLLKVFYQKAVDASDGEEVDMSRFRYSGPRPRSRETGVVQLADSIEATSSALRPSTEEEIEKLVKSIIEDHLKEGQLDNSGLTLGDIKTLRDSFIETLKGRFHMRVRYPGNEAIVGEQPSNEVESEVEEEQVPEIGLGDVQELTDEPVQH